MRSERMQHINTEKNVQMGAINA